MIFKKQFLFSIVTAALMFQATLAMAQNRPFQLSLVTPIQIIPERDTISGLTINLIYGRNAAIDGLELGIVNHVTSGPSGGLQYGFVNISDELLHGEQNGFVNISKGDIEGIQMGAVNYSVRAHGFQFGIVNYSLRTHGFQFGVINYAKSFTGLQLGLINVIAQGGQFPVFPILNWSI